MRISPEIRKLMVSYLYRHDFHDYNFAHCVKFDRLGIPDHLRKQAGRLIDKASPALFDALQRLMDEFHDETGKAVTFAGKSSGWLELDEPVHHVYVYQDLSDEELKSLFLLVRRFGRLYRDMRDELLYIAENTKYVKRQVVQEIEVLEWVDDES